MKMKNITRFTALVFVAVLSACNSKNKEGQVTLVSASKIANSGAPASEKSEEYAKAAELLMTAEGFSQAHQLSERALQQDSKNVRARFVHALSSLMMVQKGIFARIRPLAEKSPSTLSKYNQYLAEMNMKKMDSKKNIESFYLDGQPVYL